MLRTCVLLCAALPFLCVLASAAEPCQSGLQSGQRPGPYSFVVATGAQRGQSQCFVCETADRPAVVVFARELSDPLGKLAVQIDKAVAEHKAAELRGWITFLSDDQPTLDPKVVDWSKKHSIRTIPLGVFEDAGGPPSYKVHKEADVTVLFFVKRKVVANFAYRAGELTEDKVGEVMKALPGILPAK
ncbi:MAG: hypothetical protein K2R98_01315 [Gemmataceae bacterium]|nr:hypothetical protein [Gemmataceae bacterium]